MDLIENIRKVRKAKGISHEAMAMNLGITQSAYTKIEKNDTKLTVDRFFKIAEILETKVEKLLNLNANNRNHQEFKEQSTNHQDFKDYSIAQQQVKNLYQENKDFYEKLLQSKDDQINLLKSLLEEKHR